MSILSRGIEFKEHNRDKRDNVPKIARHNKKKKHNNIILSLKTNRIPKTKPKIILIIKTTNP